MIRSFATDAWTTYTPALIQNASVTHANTAAGSSQFSLVGRTMDVVLDITASAAGTATVKILVGLPSATDSPGGSVPTNQGAAAQSLGSGYGALGGAIYQWVCIFDQVNSVTPLVSLRRQDDNTNTGLIGAVAPTAAIANGDRFLCNLRYQVN
jgi:hypothetical protein